MVLGFPLHSGRGNVPPMPTGFSTSIPLIPAFCGEKGITACASIRRRWIMG